MGRHGTRKDASDHARSVEESLRMHGEAFLRMFESSSDEDEGTETGTPGEGERREGSQHKEQEQEQEQEQRHVSKKRRKAKKRHAEDPVDAQTASRQPAARTRHDDVDAIFDGVASTGTDKPRDKKSTSKPGKDPAELRPQGDDDWLRRKIERKRFMSSKSDAILSFDEEAKISEAKERIHRARADGGLDKKREMEEFKAIRREIQSFGTWCTRFGFSAGRMYPI